MLSWIVAAAVTCAAASTDAPQISEAAAKAFAERMWQTEPFVGSLQWRTERQTLGHLFSPEEYKRLRGNDLIGYSAVMGGFSGAGRVVLGTVKSVGTCANVKAGAWQAAFKLAVRPEAGPALRLEMACSEAVYAHTEESAPGVLVEMRFIDASGKTFLYRTAMGKQTLEAAMVAVIEFATLLARNQGHGQR